MCKHCSNCEHKNKFSPESVLNICGGTHLFDKDSCGFVNPYTMQGIFLSVCDEVNHPLVFIQKRNEKCKIEKNSTELENVCRNKYGHEKAICNSCRKKEMFYDKYYRLESNIFYSRLSGICKYVRKSSASSDFVCGFQSCLLTDAYAAAFFLDPISLPSEVKKTLTKGYKQNSTKNREYLEYLCPTTHYTEVAIPVKLEGKIVGVLIFGQMLKKENETDYKLFLEKISKDFEGNEDFKRDKKFFDDTIYKPEQFNIKINECIESVEKLETRLYDLLGVYRKWYIDEISHELLEAFPKIDTEKITTDGLVSTEMTTEKYEKFKASLLNLANLLCKKMNIEKMLCFAPDILPNAVYKPNLLYNIKNSNEEPANDLVFDFNTFDILYPNGNDKITNQEHIKMIIKNLDKRITEFNQLSFVLYVTSGESQGVVPIAVLFGYTKTNTGDVMDEDFISELDSLMNKIKDPIYVTASAIVNRYMEIEQRRFVQIMRHELGQSYAGYLVLLEQFQKDFSYAFDRLENSSIHNASTFITQKTKAILSTCIKNSKTFAHTVMLRVNGTRYSGGIQEPKKKYFYPYGEFLFKWNYIFLETQKNKHIRFKMPVGDVYTNPDGYPLMFADPDMIEQVVFNLTNNAMKYSHFGSSITLNCYADKKSNEYIVEIINYAKPLSKEDLSLIFNYGYSGKNHSEDGSGLGLYISYEIAKRHGGNLMVEQELISDFNVPLLQLYTEDIPENMFSKDLFKEVQTEIANLKQQKTNGEPSTWSQILGEPIPQNPFTPLYVSQNIKNKTAKIKFTLSIPLYDTQNQEDRE